MHSMDFYISTCRCVMQADPDNPETWAELHRLVPCLRQSLGCYVCFNILQDPMGPTHNVCKHTVCRKCVGGKMKLKPACSWCKDHWYFEPNILQKILVSCFKKLCMYVLSSPLGAAIGKSGLNGQSNNLINILKEAAQFDEDFTECVLYQNLNLASMNQDFKNNKETSQNIPVPGCSSDDDYGREVSAHEEDESMSDESVDQPKERLNDLQNSAHVDKINGVVDKGMPKPRNKRITKTVVFFKRAAENKNKKSKITQTIKKKAMKQSSMRKRNSESIKNKSLSLKRQDEAPNDLEKMDFSEPTLKKIKQELPPPELKPLTSCKCGKSGNTNQLTCLGQRCQCYSMKLPCIGCKCKGCRNPKKGRDSSAYPTSGLYGSSYLRSGTRTVPSSVCINM